MFINCFLIYFTAVHQQETFFMQPRIETNPEKKLVALRMEMSLVNNKTGLLWRSFMERRKEINNVSGTNLYSLQLYHELYFDEFNPAKTFTKLAAVEVTDHLSIPEGMEGFILVQGLYAVFVHKGLSSDTSIFKFIFTEWLPNSNYSLDNRPHFEVLGERYKNDDPDSEEEIWIPIKEKQ